MSASQISDEDYRLLQHTIGVVARLLVDAFDGDQLGLFIERARHSLSVGPILHPSEFIAGADNLEEVLAHARAIQEARDKILEASA